MYTNRQIFLRHIGQTSGSPLMIEIEKAEGVYMFSPTGEKYIDLISGVSVSNTGHSNPEVIAAIKKQLDSYMHLMVYGEMIQEPQVRYAEKIISLLPERLNSCFFVNSGSEAVEGALKLAKRFTGRSRIISFRNAYHGSTHGALSVQGDERYRNMFRPLLPDVYQAGFNTGEVFGMISEKTACVLVEPIQAEAGVILPEEGFLRKLRDLCTSTGTLLIFDEAQTGFGRTGSMFAASLFGICPDILVLAKALGGGMPLGAFISSSDVMSVLSHNPPLGHITTFGGHPVCCAAGLASLNVILSNNLAAEANARSALFRKYLKHPAVKEIRGKGLLLAVDTGSPEMTSRIVAKAPEYGLILDFFLFCPDAFRIAPPLTISDSEIEDACIRLSKLLDNAISGSE